MPISDFISDPPQFSPELLNGRRLLRPSSFYPHVPLILSSRSRQFCPFLRTHNSYYVVNDAADNRKEVRS